MEELSENALDHRDSSGRQKQAWQKAWVAEKYGAESKDEGGEVRSTDRVLIIIAT